MGDPDHAHTVMVAVACHVLSFVHKEHSEAVVPMATSHQNLVIGEEGKQFGADYQILGKWSSKYPCSIKCTLPIDFHIMEGLHT